MTRVGGTHTVVGSCWPPSSDTAGSGVVPERWIPILLAALVLSGGAARLYRLDAPGMLVEREFQSRIIARDYLFGDSTRVPVWRADVARLTRENVAILEPPVTERLVGLLYYAAGREVVPAARLLTTLFWCVGGLFLFGFARRLVSPDAALLATAYYLLSPLAILVSRSLQPDALLMMLSLGALLAMVRYFQRPSASRLALAAAVAGLAGLSRPVTLLGLAGAFVAGCLAQSGWRRRGIVQAPVAVFLAAAVIPAVLYYGFTSNGLTLDFESSVRPRLLASMEFWRGWHELVVYAVGYPMMAAALCGAGLLPAGLPRAVAAGLVAGYCLYGVVFTTRFYTHGEYHAQLLPVVGLASGALGAWVLSGLRASGGSVLRWVPFAALMLALFAGSVHEVRARLGGQVFESPALAARIGEEVGHSTRVAYIAPYHGLPLQYLGELTGRYFSPAGEYPLYRRAGYRERSLAERISSLPFAPEYFVITDFAEFDRRHADLAEYLARDCQVRARTADYAIYHRCHPPSRDGGER